MEEDDEFGDLYTDVLRPLQSSTIPEKHKEQPREPSPKRTVDLNLEEISFRLPLSNHTVELAGSQHARVQGGSIADNSVLKLAVTGGFSFRNNLGGQAEDEKFRANDVLVEGAGNRDLDIQGAARARVLDVGGDVKLERSSVKDKNLIDESRMEVSAEERVVKDEFLAGSQENIIDSRETYEKFDIEEVDNMDAGPLIPGLSIPGVSEVGNTHGRGANFLQSGEVDDWDSDSEDDLQIVLNDNNQGNVLMGKSGEMGSDDEDEDGEPLVIVADTDQGHLPSEEPDWGEDAGQATDGDKKEFGDVAKPDGMVAVPKVGYSSHGYHPYHSQFKYVRPGAAPMPGAASVGPGGVSGQVRPPVPPVGMPPSGRGRGDWRPSAMKNGPPLMQKGFHAGFGMPPFSAGRGFGSGLDFTLPSHKTVFEVDVDSFEEKPWKLPGIDMTDYFNFGLHEESWKDYCKQLEQHRMETTMQSKIRVYESGRAEQDYDPDLPPELAAAAGLHSVSIEPANVGKVDDLVNGSARQRPPLPIGRPIQVETGHGERFPSIDTRPTRMRDSDAIIEIVLQGSADDDSLLADDAADQPENDNLREDLSESFQHEREITEDTKRFVAAPDDRSGRKREVGSRSESCTNSIPDDQSGSSTKSSPNHLGKENKASFSPEGSLQDSLETKGRISPYSVRVTDNHLEDRCAKERSDERSPNVTPSDHTQYKRSSNRQKEEESTENIDGKHSPRLSSPTSVSCDDAERKVGLHDEQVDFRDDHGRDKEELALDATTAANILTDENKYDPHMRQKARSHNLPEADDVGDLRARSIENSKARSGSSRDLQQKLNDGIDEEVVQHRHFIGARDAKRPPNEDEQSDRRKGRHETGKLTNMDEEGKQQDTQSSHRLHFKSENNMFRRKDRESSDGTWQHRDEDLHGRRKRERVDDAVPRHWPANVREAERFDKDEYLNSRKQLDNGTSRGYRERDMASRYKERDDNSKGRYEAMDDIRGKRRKEDEYLRKNVEKEEFLHGIRENYSNHKKRDRIGDIPDLHRRDGKGNRTRDDNPSLRTKEGWVPREREEWHRIKQLNDEGFVKRERDDGRGGVRASHAKGKDGFKNSDREYPLKDSGRHADMLKRRDHIIDAQYNRGHDDVYQRGSQLSNDERRARQESTNNRDEFEDGTRTNDKKLKETTKKRREYKSGDQNNLYSSIPIQEQSIPKNELVMNEGTKDGGKNETLNNNHQSSRKRKGEPSSEDEQQLQDSKRGRSKLERWTSHKERDIIDESASRAVEETEEDDALDSQPPPPPPPSSDLKDAEPKPLEEKHLDTVAKLKKRRERFKVAVNKIESEPPLNSTQSVGGGGGGDITTDSDFKPERPARKRRWTGN